MQPEKKSFEAEDSQLLIDAVNNQHEEAREKHRSHFRYAEYCLYNYKAKSAGLENLRHKLKELDRSASVHAQSYEASPIGGAGDPVALRALKITELEGKISRLEYETRPIDQLIRDLNGPEVLAGSPNAELREILRLFYFGKNSAEVVIDKLGISRRRFYYSRGKLVNLVIEYLGF